MTNPKAYAPQSTKKQKVKQPNLEIKTSRGGSYDNENGVFESAFLILMGVFALCIVGVGLCVVYKKVKVQQNAPKAYNKRF
ncbi:UNVERIFIED_CONTAM: hypothetical protein HDU68_009920 [Siphonaria sp. JEL0065]|nr:hypothetical protein HDU68_009920 [Siphonaria sp. JEL0065]